MKKTLIFLLAACFVLPLFAEYNRFGIPDSSEIRKNLVETWFEAPLSSVRMNRPELHVNRIGQKFQIRLEETDDQFYIFAAPFARMEVDVYSDKGKSTVTQDVYPGDTAGSWLLIRDKKTGKPLKIRFYFAGNSEVYVQFYPINGTAFCDFVIFNCYAAKGVPTGLSFSRFYTASFDQVRRWTRGMLPWQYSEVYPDGYSATQKMIQRIRSKNDLIVMTEDAMYDGDGNPVFISTGKKRPIEKEYEDKITVSGPGYVKWIADGIVEPIAGGKLKREPLVTQTVEYKENGFQGILSDKFAISFALDWIRNIASGIVSVRANKNYLFNNSGVDVTIEPFSAEFTEKGIRNSNGYMENTGYSVESLRSLLYVLAVSSPETFYFGAIREIDFRSPEVKVFNECVAIFPYFDSNRRFQLVIFKDGTEVPYEEFYSRYCKDFISLVKVQATQEFFLE